MIKNFDLSTWTLFSDRRNSKSYYSADKKWMVKFNTEVGESSLEALEAEQTRTKNAVEVGVKTPKVSDIIETADGKKGLIYEYIEGKKSIARAMSEDIENLDTYMMRFARSAKDFHSKTCDPSKFVSYEKRLLGQLDKWPFLADDQKVEAKKLIDKIEKKSNCVHGDFQPSNFIMTKTEEYVIDLSSMACGNPVYDVATFYFFTHVMPYYVTKNVFHCEEKYLNVMWESFVKHYFGVSTQKEVDEISAAIKKYSVVSFHANFELIDPTSDAEVFCKIFKEVFADGIKNDQLIKL